MKILLAAVNSKYIHSNLAVHSLKAYCRNTNAEVSVYECTINQSMNSILKEIYTKKPDFVAFSCYIWNISLINELTPELKKILPLTEIWLGGPEVTYEYEDFLEKQPHIRGIMIGEGEKTFYEVAMHYERQKEMRELKDIQGIAYRDGEDERIRITAPRALMDMDELPFVYEDMSLFKNKIIYYESSRGCPFGCSYCLSSVEKQVRFKSLLKVKQELKFFLDHQVPQVKFVDRTFNCDRNRTKELLMFLKDNDNGITNFHFETAADMLGEEEIGIMKEMREGLIQLEIGVQSTNPDTIREIRRIMDFQKVSETVNAVQKVQNVHQHLDLIAGLPYEDYQSFIRSFNDVYSLYPHQLQLGFLKVLKGSEMYRRAEEYGIVHTENPPYEVLFTKWISYGEILKLKNVEEMVECYYNSGLYRNTMRVLLKSFHSPYELYDALAEYYQRNCLFEIKHSRISRYTILHDFMKTVENADIKVLEQVLLFDLYLRENLKTRPAFAWDNEKYKPVLKSLRRQYAVHKNSHIEVFFIDIEKLCRISSEKISELRSGVYAEEGAVFCLFDYEDRNLLYHDAKITKII